MHYIDDMAISGKDQQLISLLQENARAPVATLARSLGLSRATVQSRIERLEREKVIIGYGVRLSDDVEGAFIKAHVLITVVPKSTQRTITELHGIKAIRLLHSVSGAVDLIALIAAPSVSELDSIVDHIGELEGVERTQTSIILSTKINR